MEVWCDIPGWEMLYQASSLGRIRSLDRDLPYGRWGRVRRKGEIIEGKVRTNGYREVALRNGQSRRYYLVHRLVCLTFHGQAPEGKPFACHFPDPDVLNCAADNLLWGSPKDNSSHRARHDTLLPGMRNPSAKLTDDAVRFIRSAEEPMDALAERFGVCLETIRSVMLRHSWVHL